MPWGYYHGVDSWTASFDCYLVDWSGVSSDFLALENSLVDYHNLSVSKDFLEALVTAAVRDVATSFVDFVPVDFSVALEN